MEKQGSRVAPTAVCKAKDLLTETGLIVVVAVLLAILAIQISEFSSKNCSVCDTSQTNMTESFNALHATLNLLAAISYNNTKDVNTLLGTVGNSEQRLVSIVDALSNLQDTGTSTAKVANAIQQVVQNLEQQTCAIPSSCEQLKLQRPNSPSGMYTLAVTSDIFTCTFDAYCNMDQLCGSSGWRRVAYLNMSDATQSCPSGLTLYQFGGVRACGRPESNVGSCASVQFPSNNISYSQVCGRVVGYQYDSPEAISNVTGANRNDLNSYYVDGVSITRGSPRQHVWTLMADTVHHFCPCASVSPGNSTIVQSFVGDHYFCEAGAINTGTTGVYFPDDPLWDGQGCDPSETNCCLAPGIPWFHRDYGDTTTTDDLELRVCADERRSNEDSPVGYYEIYVK